MRKNKTPFLSRVLPFWLDILLAATAGLGLAALILDRRNPNLPQDLFFPALIGSVLLLVMVYWLFHIRRVEKRLQEERNLLRALIDTLPDNIFIKDSSGRILIDNNAHQRTLGANTLEQVVGKTDFDFFPAELAAQYDSDERQIIQSGKPLLDRVEPLIDKEGNQRWLMTTKVPLRDRQGKITGIVGFNHDITYRKQADEKLAEERNLLRTLIDNLPDRIFVKDTQGRKVLSNIADWQASGGKSMEEVIGKTDLDTYPPELAARFVEDDKTVLDSGVSIINREEPALDPQGRPVWTLVTKVPFNDVHGKLMGLAGVSRDITALRRAAEDLENAEERYRKIFEDSVEGIYQTTADGKIVTINPALARMLGYSSAEDMITAINDIEHEFYVDPSRRGEFQRLAEDTGMVSGFESEVYRKDGTRIWISENGRAVRGQDGTVLYYEGTTFDVTERRRAEEAQHKAEEKYRSFFENSFEGIFQTTSQGKVLSANPALAQMLGYDSPEELIATITDLDKQLYVDPAHRAELKKRLAKEDKISSFESEVYRKDGSRMWIAKNVLVVRDEQGKPLYYEGTAEDITARKQVEQARQEAQRTQAAWISELEKRTRQLSLLNEMSDLIQCCSTIEEAYNVVSQQAQWIFPQESGALYILASSRNLAESMAAWGEPIQDPPTFNPAECWAFRRRQLHAEETELTAGASHQQPVLNCPHLQKPIPVAYICVPLIAQGETVGVLHLRHRVEEKSNDGIPGLWYTEARKQLAQTVADSLALAISNLKLRESLRQQSIRDLLTGMFNRRYLEESLDREVARAVRAGTPLGVIMVDIDHFKNFNDLFGHDAGDAVLRELGGYFRSQIREADIACRYGGEEFALIMPDASLEITRQRAEKIRAEVKQLQVKHRGQLLGSVTLSLGVAEIPSHGSTGEVLIRIADAALYRAKKAGRDRVEIGKSQEDRERTPND